MDIHIDEQMAREFVEGDLSDRAFRSYLADLLSPNSGPVREDQVLEFVGKSKLTYEQLGHAALVFSELERKHREERRASPDPDIRSFQRMIDIAEAEIGGSSKAVREAVGAAVKPQD